MSKEKEQLCYLHDQIKKSLETILKSDRRIDRIDEPDELKNIIESVIWEANNAIDLVGLAYERGNAMEHRLYEYRRAIEGLGFLRSKDGVVQTEV
jgi:hypothetical protein